VAREHGAAVVSTGRRSGPGRARNLGAQAALGNVLLFVDADVSVHPDAVGRIAQRLVESPRLDAVFGCYDDRPGAENFCSQYKNLQHSYVHQAAKADASTFWSACGAIRRSVFLALGGFDESGSRPSVEDIDLGYRLLRAGGRILLDRQVLAQHHKRCTLWNLVRTDIVDRAIPWTRLIVRDRFMPSDLNLCWTQRVSSVLASGLAALVVLGLFWLSPLVWAAACALLQVVIAALNLRFYRYLASKRGWWFALRAVPLHTAYHFYSAAAFLVAASYYSIRFAALSRRRAGS
jgi:cellulose synthase/poly-beta-1,6-N-acetylglucosamine synthase-like glycosyltransferase